MHSQCMYLTIQLLVEFVYTFRNCVNVHQQKKTKRCRLHVVMVSPLVMTHYTEVIPQNDIHVCKIVTQVVVFERYTCMDILLDDS